MSFAIGQRWVSHADAQLGLGVVVAVQPRRVSLHFPAVAEDRTYAIDNAPLTRLRLRDGDTLRTVDGRQAEVRAVREQQALLVYEIDGDPGVTLVPELELDPHIELDSPRQRLLAGQYDSHAAFALRLETCRHLDRLQRSGLRGLLGTRTALLPHQLYIADEVGRRHAPRVLLADEVGLGKTIEAGMILHRQLLTGAARRVLLIVPDALQHQWLVEMRRRFNLAFALFDEERLSAQDMDNPFEAEQLLLCGLGLFTANPLWRELALLAPWDLVVVDEAHRLHWSDGEEGEDFRFVRELAQQSQGLLLLTATPEQVGQDAHFARLALLDPARFHDLQAFREEESRYRLWSRLIESLDRGETPAELPQDIDRQAPADAQIAQLIDRYGTGRVLFRNSRAAVGGFPRREVRCYPLQWTEASTDSLYPELALDTEYWLRSDPRVAWLQSTLRELRPAKVLVLCAHAETATALETQLQLRAGIRAAAFHEGLGLIERDRAAAWFAEPEQGAQALVCSEIGSEGRNFQFAQQLVLFDLPKHPDLLEQRIGRLDRIGQRGEVIIHIPFLEGTAQELLLRWYNEGLDSLRQSISAGDMVLQRFARRLDQALAGRLTAAEMESLLSDTRDFTARTRVELAQGRDRLLERSSCDPTRGRALATAISASEDPTEVDAYLERLCAVAEVEHEHHSEFCSILKPGEQERLPLFPELGDEGRTVTVSRDVALAREDMLFLGWEHPWLEEAMETLITSPMGQAALGSLRLRGVPPGSRLYECFFTIGVNAPRALQLQHYLPLAPLRLLIDGEGRDLSALLDHERLNGLLENLPRGAAGKVVKRLQDEIDTRLRDAEARADSYCRAQCSEAGQRLRQSLEDEIARLRALRAVNPAVRDDEITALQERLAASESALATAAPTLQGLRLVVTR